MKDRRWEHYCIISLIMRPHRGTHGPHGLIDANTRCREQETERATHVAGALRTKVTVIIDLQVRGRRGEAGCGIIHGHETPQIKLTCVLVVVPAHAPHAPHAPPRSPLQGLGMRHLMRSALNLFGRKTRIEEDNYPEHLNRYDRKVPTAQQTIATSC